MKNPNFYLEALVSGDSKKIVQVYEKNFANVKKFVVQNNGSIPDAEDIFQKALLQIAVRYKREKFVIKSSFEAYLFTVCKNLWRKELNKNKNKVTNNYTSELVSEEKEYALMLLEQKRQELFVEKLGLISDNCRKILSMFFSKSSYADIVAATDYKSENVVRQRVFKCKKKLIELITNDANFKVLKEL